MSKNNVQGYTKYPMKNIIIYNGTTIIHYLLGGTGIILGYGLWLGYFIGILYLVLSFAEMYVHMPLKVCPNCVYYNLKGSLCISGLNVFSRKVAGEGDLKDFSKRAKGSFCPNNLYIASLVIPIIMMVPSLVISFSYTVLAILIVLLGLLAFRFFILFPKIACIHCRAKSICPQARSMKLNNI